MTAPSPEELVAGVERGLEAIDALIDPVARQTATDAVQALLDLYGMGLEHIVQEVSGRDDDGSLARALAGDELVAHLLMLHGLHPVGLEDRVQGALAEVRPYLRSHGGDVTLLGVHDSAVHLRMQGSCSGCPSSTMTLKLAIEDAIHKAAPEIEDVIAQDAAGSPSTGPLLQIEMAPPTAAGASGSWSVAGQLRELRTRSPVLMTINGDSILFVAVGDQLYAYRPECPVCDGSLQEASLCVAELECPGCGERYDVLRAGRGLDSPQRHLEPVPLLVSEDGLVKIAVPVAA